NGAEIAAAALVESKRAEVVGERTYGDAALRKSILLDDGGAVILSVAKYYSPGGKALQDTGLTPSVPMVEVEGPSDNDDDTVEPPPAQPKSTEDLLLKKAVEIVNGKAGSVASNDRAAAPAAPKTPTQVLTPLNVPAPAR